MILGLQNLNECNQGILKNWSIKQITELTSDGLEPTTSWMRDCIPRPLVYVI